jgi:hypothetical protein
MRTTLEDNGLFAPRVKNKLTLEALEFVAADNFPVNVEMPSLLLLAPAGAIDVLMPTSTQARKGLSYVIVNTGAGTITLKTDGDAAFTQAIAITTAQMALVVCTGNTSQVLGWRAMVAAGTQTSP